MPSRFSGRIHGRCTIHPHPLSCFSIAEAGLSLCPEGCQGRIPGTWLGQAPSIVTRSLATRAGVPRRSAHVRCCTQLSWIEGRPIKLGRPVRALPDSACETMPGRPTPRLRGRLHQAALFVAIPSGIALVAAAPPGAPRVAAGIYAVTLAGLFASCPGYSASATSIERRHPGRETASGNLTPEAVLQASMLRSTSR
jgi:hypothetical protein